MDVSLRANREAQHIGSTICIGLEARCEHCVVESEAAEGTSDREYGALYLLGRNNNNPRFMPHRGRTLRGEQADSCNDGA